jgi:hypothetical protein
LWKRHGLRPAWLLDELTPFEVLFLFADRPAPDADRLAVLRETNHVTRAGAAPKVPHWLMPKVPRRARP